MKMRVALLTLCVGVLALIIAVLLFSLSHPETSDTLRVVYKPNANYLIYFVARDKGYFADEGLNVIGTEMESTNLMVQALISGQADFNPSNSVPALYAAEQNAPGTFKFLYVTLMAKGRSNNGIIIQKNSPITALSNLIGKTVGTPPGITSVVMAQLIFKGALGSWNGITFKELEQRGLLQALAANQLDAVFAIEPLITIGEEKGITKTLVVDAMETYVMDPIPIAGGVVSSDFVKANPDVVKRIQRAMEMAIDFTRENEHESRQILARAIGMEKSTANSLGVNTYWKLLEVEPDKVQRFADMLLENGALEKKVDTSRMYWKGE